MGTSSGIGFSVSFMYPTDGGISALRFPANSVLYVRITRFIQRLESCFMLLPPAFMPTNTSFKPSITCRAKQFVKTGHNRIDICYIVKAECKIKVRRCRQEKV